jgi:CDP-diacylglycerol--serine O-phosphatidyltransferase
MQARGALLMRCVTWYGRIQVMPPLKYFAPNSFTAGSLLLGLGSIVMAARGDFELSAWMILWCTLLDKVDGSVARLFKATSSFGVEFDSFADFVAFGIAPAALVYFRLASTGSYSGWREIALMLAAGLYAVALAVRLARFNIVTDSADKVFYGLPGTLMGALFGAGYLTWAKYELAPEILAYAPAYLLIGAGLMLSNLRVPKLKLRKNKALNAFQIGNVVVAYIIGPLRVFPEYLFALAVVYTVGGMGWCLAHPVSDAEDDDAHEQLAA